VKSHPVLDPLARTAIESVPYVGSFLIKVYDNASGSEEDKGKLILQLLENIQSMSEQKFIEFTEKLDANRNEIVKNREVLSELILETYRQNIQASDKLDEIIKYIKQVMESVKPIEPKVTLVNLGINNELPYSDIKELRFVLVNEGGSTLIVKSIQLIVSDCDLNTNLRSLQIAAPLQVYEYQVELQPDVKHYEILSSLYTKEHTSFYLKGGEADSFLIKLSSKEAFWYEFKIRVEWINATDSIVKITEGPKLKVEYSILL
jgi:hypothetical protein